MESWTMPILLLLLVLPHLAHSQPTSVATCSDLKLALAGSFNPIYVKASVTIDVSAGACAGGLGIITRGVTIQGGNPLPTITGGNKVEIFVFKGGPYNFTISNLQLSSGLATTGPADTMGGCISTLESSIKGTVSGVTFSNCKASKGGAIFMYGGDLTVTSSTFTGNRATGNGNYGADALGGAIRVASPGVLVLVSSNFINNIATSEAGQGLGGAIGSSGIIFVSKSTFTSNIATSTNGYAAGGAIYNAGNTLSLDGSTFSKNLVASASALSWGGAVATSTALVTSCTFTSNSINSVRGPQSSAPAYGGALHADASASIISSSFTSNAVNAGTLNHAYAGAVMVDAPYNPDSLNISSSTFKSNSVLGMGGWGGAIFVRHVFRIKLCKFESNSARSVTTRPVAADSAGYAVGGAIYSDTADTTYSSSLTRSTFSSNAVQGTVLAGGGAVYIATGLAETSNKFTGNSATVQPSVGSRNVAFGGAIFSSTYGNLTSSNGIYSGNCAFSEPSDGAGGALASNRYGGIIVNNGTFTGNTATSQCTVGCAIQAGGGGAIYSTAYLSVTKSNFKGNKHKADGVQPYANGGAINLYPGSYSGLFLASSSFTFNSASSSAIANGGAVCVGHQSLVAAVSGVTFKSNSVTGVVAGGGGVSLTWGDVELTSCIFDSNNVTSSSGDAYGGGIDSHLSDYKVSILSSSFTANTATSSKSGTARGGGIMYGGLTSQARNPLNLEISTFSQNGVSSSSSSGGAVYVGLGPNSVAAAFAGSSFTDNRAYGTDAAGGAVYIAPTAIASFCRGNTFSSTQPNYKQQSAKSSKISNDLEATNVVYFCPVVPALSFDVDAFAPVLSCNQCPCLHHFNPCDPGSTCLEASGFVYCQWPKRSRGNGFVKAGEPSLCYSA